MSTSLHQVEEMDPEVKDWFRNIGVSDADLKDQNTALFIKDFVEEHGGLEAIKNLAGEYMYIDRNKYFICFLSHFTLISYCF